MASSEKNKNIFVIHGRNDRIRKSTFDFLRSLGLNPLEWEQIVGMTGTTSPITFDVVKTGMNNSQAILVILTPDEIVSLNPKFNSDNKFEFRNQCRPNVIIEAGMALALDKDRTIIVLIGPTPKISDIEGINYIKLSNDSKDRNALKNRLKIAGCRLIDSGSDWLETGDFNLKKDEIPSMELIQKDGQSQIDGLKNTILKLNQQLKESNEEIGKLNSKNQTLQAEMESFKTSNEKRPDEKETPTKNDQEKTVPMDDQILSNLDIIVEQLYLILEPAATDGKFKQKPYELIRKILLSIDEIKTPTFLATCIDLGNFRKWIQSKEGHYSDRRNLLSSMIEELKESMQNINSELKLKRILKIPYPELIEILKSDNITDRIDPESENR